MTWLETSRLVVRNFKVGDWDALHCMINQYQSSEYAAYDYPWPTSEDEIKKITKWFASGDSYFAVCLKDTKQFIGFVSLSEEQEDNCRKWNLGYVFNFDYHGKGFATEACRAVIDHAFTQLQVQTVVTGTAAANLPSRRLLEKLGFKKIAESRGSFANSKDGSPIEVLGYSYELTTDEWQAARKQTHV